jgi:hypothetical protein
VADYYFQMFDLRLFGLARRKIVPRNIVAFPSQTLDPEVESTTFRSGAGWWTIEDFSSVDA